MRSIFFFLFLCIPCFAFATLADIEQFRETIHQKLERIYEEKGIMVPIHVPGWKKFQTAESRETGAKLAQALAQATHASFQPRDFDALWFDSCFRPLTRTYAWEISRELHICLSWAPLSDGYDEPAEWILKRTKGDIAAILWDRAHPKEAPLTPYRIPTPVE